MVKKILMKLLFVLTIVSVTMGSFANCFGKFALVRVFYNANDGINVGSGLLQKLVKTILFYIPFGFLMAVGGFVDFILFNLIEFWSGSNPVGFNEYDQNGRFAKSFEKDGEKVTLVFSDFGSRLDINSEREGKVETLTSFRNQPGKFFHEVEGKLVEIEVKSENIGSQVVLKLVEQGKIKSTKVVESKSIDELQMKATGAL
ncbi:hypothetical protein CH373_07930 [Leptospira perolatii]|uniref:DUF3332 domain-containing protein n=1 Tax=Leptospira perolatii TaxID=2023191 RepID=A0A2M9ZMX5_9LEPT|nr:DUF3332 family protein [Leptospira perolatii]PJZ68942.1 hypothetical protein CH360_13785 [Leptospira perolatii]PJZ73440.1 hypothetical protein CH373_07930 [Leptospira perolatii]